MILYLYYINKLYKFIQQFMFKKNSNKFMNKFIYYIIKQINIFVRIYNFKNKIKAILILRFI